MYSREPGNSFGKPRLWLVALFSFAVALFGANSNGPLADAVEQRDRPAIETLLKQHADVNLPQADGATALHWAVQWDQADLAANLIRAGANVNAANDLGASPLYLACLNGRATMVTQLLKAGANPNGALLTGETALMTAARTGNPDVVQVLLAHKAEINAKDSVRGQTALMWAVAEQHRGIVRVLIDQGADVNAHSKGEFTSLLFAARNGDLESAQMLVAAGARINDSAQDGGTALFVAAVSVVAWADRDYRVTIGPSGHQKVGLFLLDKGADTARSDSMGRTPLHVAVETGKVELVKAILARGANPNARMTKDMPALRGDYQARTGLVGATPFWLAARDSRLELMRILVAGGADPSITTMEGTSPLLAAAGATQLENRLPPESQVLEALKLCMHFGNDINHMSGNGQNIIHFATTMGEDNVIQFAFEHGVKLDVKDAQGRTPMDIALNSPSRPRPKTAALLRKLMGGSSSASR